MVDPASVPNCYFRWEIDDTFLRQRDLKATFYHGSPEITQWKATLTPLFSGIGNWEFLFSLEFIRKFDQRQEIVPHRLKVKITLNGIIITERDAANQRFCELNMFKYGFHSTASISSQTDPHRLVVVIQIYLREGAGRNEIGDGLYFHGNDLRCLSRDLSRLQNEQLSSNMVLVAKELRSTSYAHSYIIRARWNNFFAFHYPEGFRVYTGISYALLTDILTYMYSGTIAINWPDWTNTAYITELIELIDRYKLYHLYKVFVKSDVQQLRVTGYPVILDSCLYPLKNFLSGRQITTWRVENIPELSFGFMAQNDNQAGPWLSFSLQSTSSLIVYTKVSLEIIKMVNGNLFGRPSLFHEEDFRIEPDATVESRCVLFRGCLETFSNSDDPEVECFIRCSLSVSRSTVEKIRNIMDDTLQNESERFGVLSDHMLQLRRQPIDANMIIFGLLEGPNNYQESIHRGILAIRVPNWWEGLENIPGSGNPPDIATTTLSNVALAIVHDYIYTGKVFTRIHPHLGEIERFAQRTQFSSLLDLVNRVRLHRLDNF